MTFCRSSIFSLPISVKSGESVSSTVQAVKLLRKLYNVDTETRQNLVLMVGSIFNLNRQTNQYRLDQTAITLILAHRIRISEIIPWNRKSYLPNNLLSYPGHQVTPSCEIAS